MQCVTCRFENIPGEPACARCGTSLRLATAVIDVNPPRASPWAKRARPHLRPLRNGFFHALRSAADGLRSLFRRSTATRGLVVPLPRVWARMVVPGWAQMYCGQTQRGRMFLGVYLSLLLPGLLLLGTPWSTLLLGFAFSIHVGSALDLTWNGRFGVTQRLIATATLATALALVVYLPAGLVVSGIASPRVIQIKAGPFVEGDAVLINRWAYWRSVPKVGDVVLYDQPGTGTFLGSARGGQAVNMRVAAGELIDRIVAGPGDVVVEADGKLSINGAAAAWPSLAQVPIPKKLRLTVPPGCYLIAPSSLTVEVPATEWERVAIVAPSRVYGKAYLRHSPLGRWWVIR